MAVHYLMSETTRRQLDELLGPWRVAASTPPPQKGWLKTIREALGMTSRQVAARLGVSQSRIPRIEQAEVAGTLSLKTLREAANAMGCELVYAVIPRRPLKEILAERAHTKAEAFVKRLRHTMALEAQSPDESSREEMIQTHARELLRGPLSRLWDEEKA